MYRVFYIAVPETKLTYVAALILRAIHAGLAHGFDIMDTAGLASGTVYPALRRLEKAGLVRSKWEGPRTAAAAQRPARKYYELTRSGAQILKEAEARYRLPEFESKEEVSR
ncbi:MAG: PadR family transcriptional regulator [Bryobacteraceae bacterium]